VFLFMDRMINPAGYAAILTAYGYAAAILTMWCALAVWILWNQRRYGRRNRRSATLPAVSVEQMSSRLGVPAIDVERVRLGKRIALHLDESDRPVIESVAPGHVVGLGSAAAT
jgi:hypothetical protein